MYWMAGNSFEYNFAEFEGTQVDLRHLVGDNYPNIRYMQLLLIAEDNFPMKATADSLSAPTAPNSSNQVDIGTPRLSTIPEENLSEVSSISDTALIAVFGDVTDESRQPMTEAMQAILDEPIEPEPVYHSRKELEHDTQ
jgi:hypothetical protein